MTGLPLSDVRVVDLSRVLAGPLSTMVLGDLGADIIKVEHPTRGDDTRDWGLQIMPGDTTYYYSLNRNKRSIALDLGTEAGQNAVRELCANADVIVENFKTGGMERFGLGYETLKAINPRLIYCSISGYDRQGPEAARPGYDLVVQGESGLMSINGEAGHPPLKMGIAAVDIFTGMYAAQGILAALHERHRTGTGRRIDLALYDCGVVLNTYYGLEALVQGKDPPRYGNAHPSIVPYGVFDTADGPIVLAVGNNSQFNSFCKVLGRTDIAEDPRFTANLLRSKNRVELLDILNAILLTQSRASLLESLASVGVPCGEVLGLHDVLTGARSQGLVETFAHPKGGNASVFNPPWRFDGDRLPARRPPMLNENGDEIRRQFLDKS